MTTPLNPNAVKHPNQWSLLTRDVVSSLHAWRFWIYLGWNDIAKQYRRSFIGPVWITLNTAIFIVAFGLVGAQLFKLPIQEYLPYFCTGHILFSFLSQLINEGCQAYISADAFLKQTPYPKLAFIFRAVWRNVLMLAHNLVVVAIVLAWSGHIFRIQWLELLAASVILVLAATLITALLGALSARYRDIPMIVSSLMQIFFFVTPVIWKPDQLTERAQTWIVQFNPLAAFLDIMRAPLLGSSATAQSWTMVFAALTLFTISFIALYYFARRRIVYWL